MIPVKKIMKKAMLKTVGPIKKMTVNYPTIKKMTVVKKKVKIVMRPPIINPKTGKVIKYGADVFNQLKKEGYLFNINTGKFSQNPVKIKIRKQAPKIVKRQRIKNPVTGTKINYLGPSFNKLIKKGYVYDPVGNTFLDSLEMLVQKAYDDVINRNRVHVFDLNRYSIQEYLNEFTKLVNVGDRIKIRVGDRHIYTLNDGYLDRIGRLLNGEEVEQYGSDEEVFNNIINHIGNLVLIISPLTMNGQEPIGHAIFTDGFVGDAAIAAPIGPVLDEFDAIYPLPAGLPNAIFDEDLEDGDAGNIQMVVEDAPKKVYKKQGGKFFSYTHKMNFDLSRLGIYREFNHKNYKINCLYEALSNGGMDNAKLTQLKNMITSFATPISKLNEISKSLKVNINLRIADKDKSKVISYPTPNKKEKTNFTEVYNICCYDIHYFIDEKINITSFAIDNYETIKDLDRWNEIYKVYNGKYYRATDRMIGSFQVVKGLIKKSDKLLTKIKISSFTNRQNSLENEHDDLTLEYDEDKEVVEHVYKSKYGVVGADGKTTFSDEHVMNDDGTFSIEKAKALFSKKNIRCTFDFETNKRDSTQHTPYVCCLKGDSFEAPFIGYNAGEKMLKYLFKKWQDRNDKNVKVILYAHNSGYDFRFLVSYLSQLRHYLPQGHTLVMASGLYCGMPIEIRDSYKMITMPCRDIGKAFNLDCKKELMPYNVYDNRDVANEPWIPVDDAIKCFKKEKDQKQFVKNCEEWGLLKDAKFNALKYSLKYCMIDCRLVHQAMDKYRNDSFLLTGMDIFNYLTLPSFSDAYFTKADCYRGIYSLSGVCREFIQRCLVGGRTMISKNEKKVLMKKLTDLDATSLYSTAMRLMNGFLMGKPKVIDPENLNYKFLKEQSGYFIRINITKIGIKRAFPLMSMVDKNGVRQFVNECMETYVDKYTLEDLIKFQKISFDIIEGYYFNEGHNKKINSVIQYLFDERARYKKLKDTREKILKDLMNTAYGKTIQKPIKHQLIVYKDKVKFGQHLETKYDYVVEGNTFSNLYVLKVKKSIMEHFSRPQVGCEILSYSKRIMNKVMCLAEDNDINIYYQDTDSMFTDFDTVDKLNELYMKEYPGETLLGYDKKGNNMGEFKGDFKMKYGDDDDENEIKKVKNIYASGAIFLGKKSYLCKLIGEYVDDNGNIEIIEGYHRRMKGIGGSIIDEFNEKNGFSDWELYNNMYDCESYEFENKNSFMYSKNGEIHTGSMKRVVHFD